MNPETRNILGNHINVINKEIQDKTLELQTTIKDCDRMLKKKESLEKAIAELKNRQLKIKEDVPSLKDIGKV